MGGGTIKLALCEKGKLTATSAFAVGGRLIAFDETGKMVRIEGRRTSGSRCQCLAGTRKKAPEEDRKKIVNRMVEFWFHKSGLGDDPLCEAGELTDHLPRT